MVALDHSASGRPAVRKVRTGILAAVLAVWRGFRNRRELDRLSEMTDWELNDIGLLREDLQRAYGLPLMRDPTLMLAELARQRCRVPRR
jgi:uncharacterized protein YjiS (DUF1127 family)